MSKSTEEVIWILVRFIMGEERKTQEEVVKMLLQEALTARGFMKPMTKEMK